MAHGSGAKRGVGPFLGAAIVVFLLGVVFVGRGGLRQGPPPVITLDSDRPMVGQSVKVTAVFKEPQWGIGAARLELIQGEKSVVLEERLSIRKSPFSFWGGAPTPETRVEAQIGHQHQNWLKEGEVILRATADRGAGFLRSAEPVVVERKLVVKLRPPQLEVTSQQHYVRQGGSGIVLFRTSAPAGRSGVRAGDYEAHSFPVPGGDPNQRFVLFAVPWEGSAKEAIVVFAEDEAGNRAERPFIELYKAAPPRRDRLELNDAFLQKVVPSIASSTPGFEAGGSLIEQFVKINNQLRKLNLAEIGELAQRSAPRFLWSGPFLQMPNSARKAGFAETRDYVYQGREVDRQTHLGLDLASLSHAAVPAANSGTVVFAGWLGIYGNAVLIDHGYGLTSLYGHLSEIRVKPGQPVKRGEAVGSTGTTGLAGGDHLHLEIFVQGKSVDPVEWLDGHWIEDNLRKKMPL